MKLRKRPATYWRPSGRRPVDGAKMRTVKGIGDAELICGRWFEHLGEGSVVPIEGEAP